MKVKRYYIYIICILMIIINSTVIFAENIIDSFQGINNAEEILNNIDFIDVKSQPKDYWAKDSIYKIAGLGIIKGYGQKDYKPKNNITKAEAIALIYRALGQEAKAQQELEKFRQDIMFDISKRDAHNIWAEGYLLLAKNDGLISDTEFYQAIMPESYQPNEKNFFNMNDYAKRQEVAVWIAKAFKLTPEYDQISIFNNYADWKLTDYEKIPYIESVLKQKIMNGDNGYFYPNRIIRRDEITQLMSNIEDKIYEINGLYKKYGFVENIIVSNNQKINTDLVTKTIMLRSDDGSLNTIILNTLKDSINSKINETGTHKNINNENEVIVNKDGVLGKSYLLSRFDKLLIIYDKDNNIRYIEAKSNPNFEERVYAKIDNVDFKNNIISFTDKDSNSKSYILSNSVIVSIDNIGKSLSDLNIGDKAYILIRNGIVTRVEVSKTIYNDNPNADEGKNDVKGIVQEVNSNLYYISLYGPNGDKISTYNFNKNVQVRKDEKIASIDHIEIGDTAYLKINSDGKIELINIKSNYYQLYGETIAVSNEFIVIKFENGILKQFAFNNNIPVYKDAKIASNSIINTGDILKVTLSGDGKVERIKEINVQSDYNSIGQIYKGKVFNINKEYIILYNTNTLNKTKWNNKDQKGYIKIPIDDKAEFYSNGQQININDVYEKLLNQNVYVATYSNYSKNEKAIKITSIDGYEKLYNDYVENHYKSSKLLELTSSSGKIIYNDSTIIIKNGKLVSGSTIKNDDPVYVVGLRDTDTGEFRASVIQVVPKPSIVGIDIYRATIFSIDEGKSFTVSSFSKLNNYKWDFVNTPKTFEINNDTIISTTLGIVNNRDFTDFGSNSYKDKVVYIASKGINTLEISDALFGIYNVRGEITNINMSQGPLNAELNIQNVSILDNTTGVWSNIAEVKISAYPNSIIIKNEKLIDVEDLEIGDKIRVIKKDNTDVGDGFIILVEN